MPLPELELIEKIQRRSRSRNAAVAAGIGDDCAVVRIGKSKAQPKDALITTDLTIEGVHFRREWHPAKAVGHRCLARGLSDIAAMGGEPLAAFLSLALPQKLPQTWVDEFLSGLLQLARRYRVELAGGDISQSLSGVVADIVVLGQAPAGEAILRSGAKPGDRLYITGELGGSAADLAKLRKGAAPKRGTLRRHFFPEPRIAAGRWLRERALASAMIDVSDGLSTDLHHICAASNLGAVVTEVALPIAAGATLELALSGGEDYELLFTAPAGARVPAKIASVVVSEIGWIIPQKRALLLRANGKREALAPRGWEHFRKS